MYVCHLVWAPVYDNVWMDECICVFLCNSYNQCDFMNEAENKIELAYKFIAALSEATFVLSDRPDLWLLCYFYDAQLPLYTLHGK